MKAAMRRPRRCRISRRPRRRPAAGKRVAPLLVAAALLCAGCRREPPVAQHVVLVTLDTLRADHLGVYGSDVATPHLDRMAADGALVEQASAHTPLTRPSHVSLLTGLLPTRTGVRDNVSPAVVPEVPLLAELLAAAGFRTAAFLSSVVLRGESGLDRGFEIYSDEFDADPQDPRFLTTAQKRGDQTLAEAIGWLEAAPADQRLFVWLHLYDAHDPYEPPEPFASRYPDRPYAGEVAWTDELVGRLLAALERLGLAADSLVVVTADHGEGLGDHGELLHGYFAYESTLRVPLLVRGPGVVPGRRLAGPAALVDLMPTILELSGLAPPEGAELSGRSLAPALRGEPEAEPSALYAESLVPRLRFGWSDLRVLRDGSWKFIAAPEPELYDLAADPGEQDNLAPRQARRAAAMRDRLAPLIAAERASETADEALSAELREQLAALGYLGAVDTAAEDRGADPKEKLGQFRFANDAMRSGLELLRAGRFEQSAARFGALLERGVDSAEIRLYLGQSLLAVDRVAEAAEEFAAAAAANPQQGRAWLGLADAHSRLGEHDEALAALEAGQKARPDDAVFWREQARLLRILGRPLQARAALAAAIERQPDDPFLHAGLSELLWDERRPEEALAELRRATALGSENPRYWNALGQRLGELGRFTEAEPAFRHAVSLAPDDPAYAFNLALAVARQNRPAEARPLFERALELDPTAADARAWLEQLDRLE